MPRNEIFWNPYRMVTVQNVERKSPQLHHRFAGISGTISGKIKAFTPIFVGSTIRGQFFKTGGRYCIPATSFKGMLRSLVEIVGKGCDITGKNGGCSDSDSLCVACRLFGMSVPGKANILFQGKVFIGDLPLLGIWKDDKQIWIQPHPVSKEVLLSSPRPTHRAFYDPAKRKFYHHQAKLWSNIINQNNQRRMIRNIYPLPENSEFKLDIRVENLNEQELALLLYCLELEHDITMTIRDKGEEKILKGNLLHKIGAGKPLGLGSIEAKIDPQREDFFQPNQRYRNFASKQICPSEDQWQSIQQEKARYHQNGEYDNQTLKELRGMLLFPEKDERNYQYPTNEWFSENSQVGLKSIYETFLDE